MEYKPLYIKGYLILKSKTNIDLPDVRDLIKGLRTATDTKWKRIGKRYETDEFNIMSHLKIGIVKEIIKQYKNIIQYYNLKVWKMNEPNVYILYNGQLRTYIKGGDKRWKN